MTKPESPNEIRSPNAETEISSCFGIRHSDFVIHSGIRVSSFGFRGEKTR